MSLSGLFDPADLKPRPFGPPAFDFYYKWFGIPPSEQPPHHYRLLGIPGATSDAEVIENAAQQRQMFLLTLLRSEHAAEAQRLFDDVTAAKKCLLDQSTRETYDRELQGADRTRLDELPAERDAPPPLVIDRTDPSAGPFVQGTFARPRAGLSLPLINFAGICVSGVIGLVLGYLLITTIDIRFDFLKLFPTSNPRVVAEVQETKPDELPLVEVRPVPSVTPVEVPRAVAPGEPLPELAPSSAKASVEPGPPRDSPLEPPPALPPSNDVPERSPAEVALSSAQSRLGESLERSDLASALVAAAEVAKLTNENSVRVRLRILEQCSGDSRISQASFTLALALLLEEAIAADDLAAAGPFVDRLLLAARQLNDRELQRRATLIALKVRQGSEQ